MMWQYGYTWNWGGFLVMAVQMVMGLGIMTLIIWGIIQWVTDRPTIQVYAEPLDILRQRYARGEIDEVTFHTMHAHLQATGSSANPSDTPTRGS